MELKLQLKGVLQSYGGSNPWTATRKTEIKPTKSAVMGLIECSLGLASEGVCAEDDLVRNDLWAQVDIEIPDPDHSPEIMIDDQIVKELTEDMFFTSANGAKKSTALPQIEKHYIVDDCFTVILKGDEKHIENIKYHLQHPVYPYSLGRACCIPSAPVVR